MTADDLHPAIREALALHEVFRRLNFTPSEIYVRPPHTQRGIVFVTVKRSGLEFNCSVEHIPCSLGGEEFATTWAASVHWWNSNRVEATQAYESSRAFAQKIHLVMALVQKGFSVRKADA